MFRVLLSHVTCPVCPLLCLELHQNRSNFPRGPLVLLRSETMVRIKSMHTCIFLERTWTRLFECLICPSHTSSFPVALFHPACPVLFLTFYNSFCQGRTGSSLCIIYELINDLGRKKIKRHSMLGMKWTESREREVTPPPPPPPAPPASSTVMSVEAELDWSLSVSGQLHGSLVITESNSQIRGLPVFFLTGFHKLP